MDLPEWSRILVMAVGGIALGTGLVGLATYVMPLYAAFTSETVCPAERIWSAGRDNARMSRLQSEFLGNAKVLEQDPRYDIERIGTPERQFWVKRSGEAAGGVELIAYLMAEHSWMVESNPRNNHHVNGILGKSLRLTGDRLLDPIRACFKAFV